MAKRFISVLLVKTRLAKFPVPHIPEELQSCMKIENQRPQRLTIKRIKKLQQSGQAQKTGPASTTPSRVATARSRGSDHSDCHGATNKV
jgi:hypothetical protein